MKDFKVVMWKDKLSVLYVERWRPEIKLFCFAVWGNCVPITEMWGERLEVAHRASKASS